MKNIRSDDMYFMALLLYLGKEVGWHIGSPRKRSWF